LGEIGIPLGEKLKRASQCKLEAKLEASLVIVIAIRLFAARPRYRLFSAGISVYVGGPHAKVPACQNGGDVLVALASVCSVTSDATTFRRTGGPATAVWWLQTRVRLSMCAARHAIGLVFGPPARAPTTTDSYCSTVDRRIRGFAMAFCNVASDTDRWVDSQNRRTLACARCAPGLHHTAGRGRGVGGRRYRFVIFPGGRG